MSSQPNETIHGLIEAFKKNRKAQDITPATAANLESRLGLFEKFCDEQGMKTLAAWTSEVMDDYISTLRSRGDLRPNTNGHGIKGLSDSSVRTHYTTLRSLARYGSKTGRMPYDPTGHFSSKAFPNRHREKRALTDEEIRSLFQAVREGYSKETFKGEEQAAYLVGRNEAILALLLSTGMRRAEAISARMPDLDMDAQELRFIGKGDREDWVAFDAATAEILSRYLKLRSKLGPSHDYIFTTWTGDLMTGSAIRRLFRCLQNRTGIKDLGAHMMRHSAITYRARYERNPFLVQKFARHAKLDTTLRYLHVTRDELKKASRDYSPVAKLA